MGFQVQTGDFTVTQYGQSSKAQLRVDEAVGFALQSDGTYSMVGDFYHARGNLQKYYNHNAKFQQELTTAYAIEDAKQKLEDLNMGWEITENSEGVIGNDGLIRMVATCWN